MRSTWASVRVVALLAIGCAGAPGPTVAHPDAVAAPDVPRRAARMGDNQGALSAADPRNGDDAYYHVWQVELAPSQRVRIWMESRAIDSMIEVTGPDDQHVRNDDAFPGVLDAMVDFVPRVAGTYEIVATTYSPGQQGPSTLHVEPRGLEGVGPALTLGATQDAQLAAGGPPREPGSWLHFQADAGSVVRLRVTSRAFDTIATLIGPRGQTWLNDDANDVGENNDERALDSTIVAALPETGIYHLVVTPYGQGAGPFRVRSEVRPPVLLDPSGAPPERLAGPNANGRLLGLYAGISAYENYGQLYGCADDARLLAQAMREAHLQREQSQLVLPDGLATREAFLSGIRQLAQQATADDVVLVFFSGHGQQDADEQGGEELDQLDETIVLFDGPLRDDEVVSALSEIHAGTVILALDACYAGGFADDWVRAPGRVGLFSSDEDVLSDVASPHHAGGYLSWFLRRGVLGEADARPRDGVLNAGELTDYLYEGFVRDHRLMNPDPMDPAQRLVVRRGAVSWDDVLWVYPRNRDLTLPPVPDVPLTSR